MFDSTCPGSWLDFQYQHDFPSRELLLPLTYMCRYCPCRVLVWCWSLLCSWVSCMGRTTGCLLLWKLAWRLSVSRKLVFRNEPFRSVPLKFPGLFLKCVAPLALGLTFHLQRRETNKGSSNRYLQISWTALTNSSQEGFSYLLLGLC